MSLITMNLLTNTTDALLIFYFLTKLLQRKNINVKKRIFLISLIIFNTLVNQVFGVASLYGFIAIFTISTIIFTYLLDEKLYRALIYSILGTVLMFIVEIITANIITIIFKIGPSVLLELNIYRIILFIFSKSLFFLIIKYAVDKLDISRFIEINNLMPVILIGIFNILIMFMVFILYKYMGECSNTTYVYLTIMGLGSIFVSWFIYKLTNKIIYQNQQEIILKVREEEFGKKDFYIKSMNDILNTIKSQRHDLNNYLSTLYGLIHLGKFEETEKYIKTLNNRVSNMNNIIETNHPIITALVSMKKHKAFDSGIDMELDIDLPEKMEFDFIELSIIIGNLLDNAIEACQLILDKNERKISLSIYVEDNCLITQVINSKINLIKLDAENIIGRFTTKSDGKNHGFGLGNIEFVVKQYNGTMKIEDLGNEFRAYISLPFETVTSLSH